MPKLPGSDSVGSPGSFRSSRDYLSARDVDGSAFGRGFAKVGEAITKISVDAKNQADDLDAIRADVHWKKNSLTSAEAIETDPDHAARGTRWGLESSTILDDAAGLIRDPKMREKFKLQKSVDQNAVAEKFKGQAVAADKEKKLTDLRTYLDETQNRAIDPKRDNNARLQDYADLDAYIQYAEKKGMLGTEQARAFRNDYIKGTSLRLAKTMADTDPETLGKYLESLPAYGSDTKAEKLTGNLSRITTQSGAKFSVADKHVDRFSGLLRDLEAAGVPIDPESSGGYNDRNIAGTNKKSYHASGSAIDINWNENARGKPGKIREIVPPDKLREIAAKHGLKWGGDFKGNPDDMHFEVDPKLDPKPVAERGLTRVAGLEGAKMPGQSGTMTDATRVSESAEDIERRALATKLFGSLDPEQRASLIKAAKARSNEKKQSQYWNDTQAAEGAIKMLEDRGELPEGFDWDATVNRIGDVQASRANGLSVEYKQAKAINQASQSSDGRPLIHMGNADLEAHVAKLAKDRRDEKDPANFEIRDTVFRKVGERASKILKLREEDPAKAVDGDPLTGTAGHPFVEAARKQATAVEQVTDPSGGIVEQPVMSEIEGNRLIVQARLKAQEDLGISPDLRTPITEGEARAILNMPDPEGLPIEDYTRRLEEASANAEKAYGSDVAPDVMKAAIKFHIKDKNLKAIAPGVVSNILTGRPVEPGDLKKLRDAQKLSEFDRLMSGANPGQGPKMGGPYQSPTFSREQQRQGRTPSPQDIDGLRRFPQSARKFDEMFGPGAAAKALKEPVKSEPPAAR
jgi:hypothetical protein